MSAPARSIARRLDAHPGQSARHEIADQGRPCGYADPDANRLLRHARRAEHLRKGQRFRDEDQRTRQTHKSITRMTGPEIIAALEAKFGDKIKQKVPESLEPHV